VTRSRLQRQRDGRLGYDGNDRPSVSETQKNRQPMRVGALFEDVHVVLKMHPNITTTGRPRRAKRS
jgi:hypothetical protein